MLQILMSILKVCWLNIYDSHKHAVLSSRLLEFQKFRGSNSCRVLVNAFGIFFCNVNGIWVLGTCNFILTSVQW